MRIRLLFVWQDVWVGGYWDDARRRLYVCLVPMLPIVLSFKVPCPTCNGTGVAEGYVGRLTATPHWRCKGTGKVFL